VKVFILLFCIPLSFIGGFSQDSVKIDSLVRIINLTTNDTLKSDLYRKLFWEYRRSDPDKALEYAEQSLQISRSLEYKVGIANSLMLIGIIKKVKDQYQEAFEYLKEACNHFIEMNDTLGIVSCLTDLGDNCNKQNDLTGALEYLDSARNLALRRNYSERLSRIFSMIGGIYTSQQQFEKALEYHIKSLDLNTKFGNKLGISVNYNNIGNVFLEEKKYALAEENYQKAIEIKLAIRDHFGLVTCYNNLGVVCREQGRMQEAIAHHEKALAVNQKLGDHSGVALGLINLAHDYDVLGNTNKAVQFAKQGLEIADEYRLIKSQSEACKLLSDSYAKLKQFGRAYDFQKLYEKYQDSVQNIEVVRQITEMESRFEAAKKEKEIALLNAAREKQDMKLKQQKAQRNLMAGLIILAIAVLIFLYLGYRNKKRVNVKLKELNETKSRFFANISHEFRTPLTLLLGPLEKLMSNPGQEDKEMIRLMHRNASRLLVLDNQLLDLSKLESGKLRLKVTESKINPILRGMAMSFHSMAERMQINFNVSAAAEELSAFFDQDKLEKIVYNLLSNAFKFTQEKGTVSFEWALTTEKPDKSLPQKVHKIPGRILSITVSDTGVGIDGKHLPFIFDRFYQADAKLSRQFEGTGLGLALTKELVELHHGYIEAESVPGKGSIFRVYLPADRQAYQTEETGTPGECPTEKRTVNGFEYVEGTPGEASADGMDITGEETCDDKPRVLIVEDNADMRNYIRDCFHDRYEVLEAADGAEGFSKATDKVPDIIISDLMMPEMDGLELCSRLKADERSSHIPVILLTALASVENRLTGLKTGADDYIAKPFNREELTLRAHNLIEQRQKLFDRFSKTVRLEPKDITVTPVDEAFIGKLIAKIEKHIADPDLNVDYLLEEIHLSRSQLHRKLKALTGLSATEFIRTIRLKRAAQLLKQHHGTIAETVYAVGFNNLSYFSKCFQKQFEITPREYTEKNSSA